VSEPPSYQGLLDHIRRGDADQAGLLRRVSELLALVDLVGTLSSDLSSEQILESALLIVMGQLQCGRGCLLVKADDGYQVRAARGLPTAAPRTVALTLDGRDELLGRDDAGARALLEEMDLEVLCPVLKGDRVIAALGLGKRAGGRGFGREEGDFLRAVADIAAAPLENALMSQELRRLTQRLSVKVFQLHNLFDISRELVASLDEDTILHVLSAALMGQLMSSRCVVYLAEGTDGLRLAHERGVRAGEVPPLLPAREVESALAALHEATLVRDLEPGRLRDALSAARLALAVPVSLASTPDGVVAVGERASGAPFASEDREFALTLARQAAAALQTVRLHRVRVEKQRQDREMQIARGIQQSLFPAGHPDIPGFELCARSIPCYEVGGDHYDYLPLTGGRWALTVADVSGKGTPASLLMAGVHAWLRALAGTAAPSQLMRRLNRFLCASTEPHRYVTLFYAELDPFHRRLVYVNGGHVPPFLLRKGGGRERLLEGGPALGLIDEAGYEHGQATLDAGDVLALVTDGVTEGVYPEDVEKGDAGVFDALDAAHGAGAEGILEALVASVQQPMGGGGNPDDLTAMILKAEAQP
jgi:phosphoserine phosphatase RsbU/P